MSEQDLQQQARVALDLALAAGADDAVVGASEGRAIDFQFRDGSMETVQESASRSLGLRLYVDGRYSVHSTNDLRHEPLSRFVSEAVALTRHLQPDPHRIITPEALYAGRSTEDLDLVDEALEELDRDRILGWLTRMDEIAHEDARTISASSGVNLSRGEAVRIASNGFEGVQRGTSIWYGAEVTLDEGNGRRPEAHHWIGGRHLEGLDAPEGVAAEALQRARDRLGAEKGASVTANLVVDREAAAGLLGRIFGSLTASAVQQKRSFLAGRAGEPIAAAILDIRDEPLLVRGLASRHYDGEGIASRPMPVIEQGRLANFYVDTYYGRKLGWEPTTGSPSNLVVGTGDLDLAGMVGQAGTGYLVTSWLGGNADSTTGDFSFGMRGNRIENGVIGGPVSEMNITGNFGDLLHRLAAVGNDPLPWSTLHTPCMLFEGVQFSGA